MFLRNVRCLSRIYTGVTSQKTELFKLTLLDSEDLSLVTMMSIVSWDVTPYSPV
jgi:hypothetical protein